VDLQLPFLLDQQIPALQAPRQIGEYSNPLTKLSFFAGLSRARSPPFYNIPGIHGPEDLGTINDDDNEAIVLIGGYGSRTTTAEGCSSPCFDTSSAEGRVRRSTQPLPQNIGVANEGSNVATEVAFDDDGPESSKRVSEVRIGGQT